MTGVKNIIRMTLWQTRKISMVRTIFITVFLSVVTVLMVVSLMEPEISLTEQIKKLPAILYFTVIMDLMASAFIVCSACGSDFGDRTVNYELLSGHTRRQVYFGKIAASLIYGMTASALIIIIPLASFGIFGSFGDDIEWGGALVRFLLVEMIFLRMFCELAAATFLFKNEGAANIIVSIVSLGGYFLAGRINSSVSCLFGISNLMDVLNLTERESYTISSDFNIIQVTAFRYMPEPELIIKTVICSAAACVLSLTAGYLAFSEDDMK